MSRAIMPTPQGNLASWRPSARLDPAERYGRFEILGRIGRGGMAEILLARERSLPGATRHLVIKRVLPEVADDDDMLRMFLDEARVVMGLSHPNLCQIYEVGQQDGTWFIAMEWVNGITLHQLIRRGFSSGELDHGVIARVAAQCAEALHHAHTARDAEGAPMRLVHRDVSPHNVMVAYDGRVKLLDFGIAKSIATTHQTDAGVVKGKICYMAPEQWLSQPVDARTDVFALGACLHEALCGRVLFKRDTQMEVMRAALTGDVPLLTDVAEHVPEGLAAIVHRALATRPADRFPTARAMGEALDRFIASSGEPVGAARVADYARRLFRTEVRLGPVLERGQRGAELDPPEPLVLPTLPPLPPLPVLPSHLAPSARSSRPPRVPPPPAPSLRSPLPPLASVLRPAGRALASAGTRAAVMPVALLSAAPASAHARPSLPAVLSTPSDLLFPDVPTRGQPDLASRIGAFADVPTRSLDASAARASVDDSDLFADVPTRSLEAPARSSEISASMSLGALTRAAALAPPFPMPARTPNRVSRLRRLALGAALAASVPMLFAAHAAYTRVPTPLVKQLLLEDRQPPAPQPAFAILGRARVEPAPPVEPPQKSRLARRYKLRRANAVVADARPKTSAMTLLSIDARPGTRVYLGKKMLGTTPLVRVQVPRPPIMLKLVERNGRVHLRRITASPQQRERAVKLAL